MPRGRNPSGPSAGGQPLRRPENFAGRLATGFLAQLQDAPERPLGLNTIVLTDELLPLLALGLVTRQAIYLITSATPSGSTSRGLRRSSIAACGF